MLYIEDYNENNFPLSSDWELVPLPDDDNLVPASFGTPFNFNYIYNPLDPPNGNHNHKAYSVHIEDDIIWVGTADGINKGE